MPEKKNRGALIPRQREMTVRYRGRGSQVWIYFGKMLRMFVYQSDWKVIPMSALIAGLVGFVIRRRMFLNMEGTLMGSFALVCVCIWNGCFNSIQVVCRERDVIKREHRSGMHISSYVTAHMLYQALICLAQTGVTLFITLKTGVRYPEQGLFTPWLIVDIGISMFLITYASDMLSLWISSLARSSTTAMTIMPFVLIFQLVFSGGMLSLPDWSKPITWFTISNPGLKVVAAQADVNNRPFVTISNMLVKMKDNKIELNTKAGKLLDLLERVDDPRVTDLLDLLKEIPGAQEALEKEVKVETTVGEVLQIAGEEEVRHYIEQNAAQASYNADYENTKDNITAYWMRLVMFVFVFALLAMITLEFIDKDKR